MRKYRHGDVNIIKPKGNKEIWKLARNSGPKHKYTFDSSILNQWSPELAWLLGWTITDGCIENTTRYVVGWMLKDREPLEIIQKLFKTEKPIEECYKTNKKTKEKYSSIQTKEGVKNAIADYCNRHGYKISQFVEKMFYISTSGSYSGSKTL
jgi:ribosomal protein S17E